MQFYSELFFMYLFVNNKIKVRYFKYAAKNNVWPYKDFYHKAHTHIHILFYGLMKYSNKVFTKA